MLHTVWNEVLESLSGILPESPLVRRFRESMAIDYYKWHDGIGYDIALIAQANMQERTRIEALLLARGARDWRDVEALAALATPPAQDVLRAALQCSEHVVAIAVLDYAPHLPTQQERITVLRNAIAHAEIGSGLAEVLRHIQRFHPQPILDALFQAVLQRPRQVVPLLVAMLLYLHGKAKSDFDYDQRPFFFRFQEAGREPPFRELCARVGADPARYLNR